MIASAIGWWADAGVDTTIGETPRNWLASVATIDAPAKPGAEAQPEALPADLPGFQAWLAEAAYMPAAAPPRRRVAPSGDSTADLMIVADMPDEGDSEAGHLFAGETARLFDAMLAAIGRTRATVYLAPLSPARIPGGRIDPARREVLARLMRHHIALVRPRALLLLGEECCLTLLGIGRAEAQGGLRALNHAGGMVPAMAIPHPRNLRQHPAAKAEAWAGMRRLIGDLAR